MTPIFYASILSIINHQSSIINHPKGSILMTVTKIEPEPSHALLSASSAERWLTCTPSARIEEAIPDEESEYALDGTAAHAFAELRLRYYAGKIVKDEYVKKYADLKDYYQGVVSAWGKSDWDAIQSYVDYVTDAHHLLDMELHIERRVNYSRFAQGGFGTADAMIVAPKEKAIAVIDLKFGKGVPVSAEDNPQLKLYALGGLLGLGLPDEELREWTVDWTIHQPRLGNISTDTTTGADLLAWAEEVVKPAAELAWKGEGVKVPSERACRFCKIRATCRERVAQSVNVARRDFLGDPDLRFDATRLDEHVMGMDEVAKILPELDSWIAWAQALKQYALEAVRDRGETVEGYKLVRGRSVRRWEGTESEIMAGLQQLNIPFEDMLEPPKPPPLLSVAKLESKIGKTKFREVVEGGLVAKTEGTPTLVPETDPRDAINRAKEALDEFNNTKP